MAVLFTFGTVWLPRHVVARNMQEVAADPDAWAEYLQIMRHEPAVLVEFRVALAMNIEVPMSRVRAFAAPPPVVVAPVPVPVPAVVPRPQKLTKTICSSATTFRRWLVDQDQMVANSAALRFDLGLPYELKDGTISVPICIFRSDARWNGTDFVFHYHPGVKGPRVGHGEASTGHFKPRDGARKDIRVTEHQAGQQRSLKQLWTAARTSARRFNG